MRHKVFGRKLNRDIKERKALFKSLIRSLIVYGRIKTTIAKAKAIQPLVDKLITKVKDGSEGAINQISAFLTKKDVINKLTKEIAPRFEKTFGGYLRLRKLGKRAGDASEEVILEWSVEGQKTTVSTPAKIEEKKKILNKKPSDKREKK